MSDIRDDSSVGKLRSPVILAAGTRRRWQHQLMDASPATATSAFADPDAVWESIVPVLT